MIGNEGAGRRRRFVIRRRNTRRMSAGAGLQRSSPLDVNLGIDFGTSYTKVCYQDLGTEESGVFTFGDQPYVPSIVRVGEGGVLSSPLCSTGTGAIDIPYLKMRLGGEGNLGTIAGYLAVDLGDPIVVRALSSYYLAEIIRSAKAEFGRQQAERAAGRTITWSANVGVPVEHYDSPKVDVFKEVFATAWEWEQSGVTPRTVEEAIRQYGSTRQGVDIRSSDCHAVPEVVAAVWSFVTSREAKPGIYTYFDIGGGTVDGVCFKYDNYEGSRRIRCYSGRVAPLGISALTHRLGRRRAASIEAALAAEELPARGLRELLAAFEDEIQTLVGHVIMTGKQKTSWVFERSAAGRSRGPLPIFLGGGGARSAWYQMAIGGTYGSRQHGSAGVPPYDLQEVPKPPSLKLNGLRDGESFPRFTIAYGLSVPQGGAPEFDLPSKFPRAKSGERQSHREGEVVPFERYKAVYE